MGDTVSLVSPCWRAGVGGLHITLPVRGEEGLNSCDGPSRTTAPRARSFETPLPLRQAQGLRLFRTNGVDERGAFWCDFGMIFGGVPAFPPTRWGGVGVRR